MWQNGDLGLDAGLYSPEYVVVHTGILITETEKFNKYIDKIMTKISKENRLIFCMHGDFNVNLLHYNTPNYTHGFINNMICHYLYLTFYTQLVSLIIQLWSLITSFLMTQPLKL